MILYLFVITAPDTFTTLIPVIVASLFFKFSLFQRLETFCECGGETALWLSLRSRDPGLIPPPGGLMAQFLNAQVYPAVFRPPEQAV